VHQAKYAKDILKKFRMDESKLFSTPMSTSTALDVDKDGEPMDQKVYRSMIGSLLYFTTTRQGHPVFCVSVRSFLGVTEDFTSAGRQAGLQVSSIHS
jgi:hypothetical protein